MKVQTACRRLILWAASWAPDGGKPMMAFFEMVKTFIKDHEADTALKADILDPLKAASKELQTAGDVLRSERRQEPERGAGGLV